MKQFNTFLDTIHEFDPILIESIQQAYITIFEAKEKKTWKIPHKDGKKGIVTDIPPEKRTTKNLPRFATGKAKVRFQDWLCLDDYVQDNVAKSPNGKWYGWSHRAMYGFGIGDKVKKGDCAYKNKEYTIKTDEEAKKTAINFADSVS